MSTCAAIGLDCSKTCCLETKCAKKKTDKDCLDYNARPFLELYIGLGTILAIFIGIPIILKIVNCLIFFKFCQRFDEMSQTHWGGYSICDCLSFFCACFCYKR